MCFNYIKYICGQKKTNNLLKKLIETVIPENVKKKKAVH